MKKNMSYVERLRIYESEKQKINMTAKDSEEYERRLKKLVDDLKI